MAWAWIHWLPAREVCCFFFFQAEDGIRYWSVTGVQTCALPIYSSCNRCSCPASEARKGGRKCERKIAWISLPLPAQHPRHLLSTTPDRDAPDPVLLKIGRASCRERV